MSRLAGFSSIWGGGPGAQDECTGGLAHSPALSGDELVADGQAPDPLACRGEDRIRQRGGDGGNTRLTDTAARLVVFMRAHEVNADLPRGCVDAGDLEAIEVVLLGAAVLEGDLRCRREPQAHDHGAFHLRADAVGIDPRAAVDELTPRGRLK